jgi:CRP/FNR family cyclic AMP-dependent transcriptional regulator
MVSSAPRQASTKVRRSKHKEDATSLAFDVGLFLQSAGLGRKVVRFRRNETVFAQGDPATSVIYVQEGGVRLTVVNNDGKEAVVAIHGPGDFVGEACLGGQSMIRVLHEEHEFSDQFVTYVLLRNIRVEEDLVDQLFNSSEKRLARTLLLLARYGKDEQPQKVVAEISQQSLAEMIGTTRSRVNFFMNKFRKLGFIEYNGGLHVNASLLSVVLHE